MPAAFTDQAASSVAPDEILRPQRLAVGQCDVHAGVVLRETGHLGAVVDRDLQLADPAGEDALDVLLPQPEPVGMPGGKVADVQTDAARTPRPGPPVPPRGTDRRCRADRRPRWCVTCRPPAREPGRSWLARRSTMATSTPANASSPASISPVGPPPAITTACSLFTRLTHHARNSSRQLPARWASGRHREQLRGHQLERFEPPLRATDDDGALGRRDERRREPRGRVRLPSRRRTIQLGEPTAPGPEDRSRARSSRLGRVGRDGDREHRAACPQVRPDEHRPPQVEERTGSPPCGGEPRTASRTLRARRRPGRCAASTSWSLPSGKWW